MLKRLIKKIDIFNWNNINSVMDGNKYHIVYCYSFISKLGLV